jgi:hypothetical protein
MVLTGTTPREVVAALGAWLGRAGIATSAFNASLAHGFTQSIPSLAAFGVGVLVIDVAMACAVALLYFVVRPRLAARLAPVHISETP